MVHDEEFQAALLFACSGYDAGFTVFILDGEWQSALSVRD